MLQLLREKKVLVTINKRIASEDSLVQDGDAVRFVGHDSIRISLVVRPVNGTRQSH
jgi:hypothetical protein